MNGAEVKARVRSGGKVSELSFNRSVISSELITQLTAK